MKSLHNLNFDILLELPYLTEINIQFFIYPVFLGDKNYIKCNVDFKINTEDNSVNDTQI